MQLPKIDLAMLPDLTTLTGMFGTLRQNGPGHDDSIVILATFIYSATN